jgi:hypothetical protein
MSTVMISSGQSGLFAGAMELVETGFTYTERQSTTAIEGVRVKPPGASAKQAQQSKHLRKRVLRRIRGFLIEEQGGEARVAFVENDQPIQYYLPSDRLRKSGIVAQNQPFEMDEVEIQADDGLIIIGYSFRPLAKPSDAFVDSIDLNDDLKRKRALIFQKFGKAKG